MQSLHLMFKPSFLAANFPNALIGRSRPQALQTFVASAYTLLHAFRLRRSGAVYRRSLTCQTVERVHSNSL